MINAVRALNLILLAVTLGLLYVASEPAGFFGVKWGVTILAVALWPLALGSAIWQTLARRRNSATSDKPRLPLRHLAIAVGCLVLMTVGLLTHWPVLVRFRLSKPSFDNAVLAWEKGAPIGDEACWCGLYHVQKFDSPSDGVLRFKLGAVWVEDAYFVYRRDAGASSLCRRLTLAPHWYLEWWEVGD